MQKYKLSNKQRLVFALDVPTLGKAAKLVRLLDGTVGCFKVGLELFIKEGPSSLKVVSDNSNAAIFLDLKLYDITATVRAALRSAFHYGVKYVTVHCESGIPILRKDWQSLDTGVNVLGITILTSIGEKELPLMGIENKLNITDLVLLRAQIAQEAGFSGVVCSGSEVASVRRRYGNDFLLVTPGIRPEWSDISGDDQARTTTPRSAIALGADLIVVGRPILSATDPKGAAQKILDEIRIGLEDRQKSA